MDPDMEKSGVPTRDVTQYDSEELGSSSTTPASKWLDWFNHIEDLAGIEARGIERVPEEERHKGGTREYMQMMLLWLSANLTANNTTVGILGPLVFGLGFTDAALCATFGGFLGAAGVGFTSMWGPRSGNRTLVDPL
ncbi:Vitamin B6 transporter [Paecilomyces lecythidis]|uniref:Vitamin B6 transporter n=1 Tax=Paecilomyces lecythidis TaxID=3004212 RepID=A0ABR3YCP5_9EURO